MSYDQKMTKFIETLNSEPPVPCDFKVGEKVTFTNEYGVSFSPHTIVGFDADDSFYGRFIYLDYDCYWFPAAPDSLTLLNET